MCFKTNRNVHRFVPRLLINVWPQQTFGVIDLESIKLILFWQFISCPFKLFSYIIYFIYNKFYRCLTWNWRSRLIKILFFRSECWWCILVLSIKSRRWLPFEIPRVQGGLEKIIREGLGFSIEESQSSFLSNNPYFTAQFCDSKVMAA